jgi:uncharacterized protein (TIGR03435 family)
MDQLIRILPNHLGGGSHIMIDRPLLNQTGLSGGFDFTLEWTPDPVSAEVLAPSTAPSRFSQSRPFAFPLESNAPRFLSALEEQLGIRFEHQLAPEPVLVIDRIERPLVD